MYLLGLTPVPDVAKAPPGAPIAPLNWCGLPKKSYWRDKPDYFAMSKAGAQNAASAEGATP
jgi:hypothetical protein